MKKKTVTSETEEITIDNKKQKRKREKKAYREIRWDRLDNTAHLFPVIAGENMSNVYRISVTLTELVQPDILQQALNIVLPKMDGFNLRLRMGVFLRRMESLHRKYVRRAIFRAAISSRIKTTVICSA